VFRDRTDAGRQLAELVADRLRSSSVPMDEARTVVMGLPRGGVPVAALVAKALGAPLDVLVVRKIGVPWQPELAMGAVGENGAVVLNDGVVASSGVSPDELDSLIRKASREVEQVVAELRPAGGRLDVMGRMVVVVDDGVATGATARAAAGVLHRRGAGPVILATATAPPDTCDSLWSCFDDVICVEKPRYFGSVGQHYEHFEQVGIDEVRRLLSGASS
jgi:putative phosphoribosyl transferase